MKAKEFNDIVQEANGKFGYGQDKLNFICSRVYEILAAEETLGKVFEPVVLRIKRPYVMINRKIWDTADQSKIYVDDVLYTAVVDQPNDTGYSCIDCGLGCMKTELYCVSIEGVEVSVCSAEVRRDKKNVHWVKQPLFGTDVKEPTKAEVAIESTAGLPGVFMISISSLFAEIGNTDVVINGFPVTISHCGFYSSVPVIRITQNDDSLIWISPGETILMSPKGNNTYKPYKVY